MKNHREKIKFKFSKINLKILNYVKKTMDILKKIKINLNEKKYLNLKNNSEKIIMKLIMTIYSKIRITRWLQDLYPPSISL